MNATEILNTLSEDDLRDRLAQIELERRSITVLLRAVRKRANSKAAPIRKTIAARNASHGVPGINK